ncbi:MAG TPA: acetoacetate--CoA ligase [Kineosporiaceae bacterium]|nr:acetoacetate--CoA ligase [Kineosporiaceae bacterium]
MSEQPLWTPSKSSAQARIWSLLELVNQRYDVELPRTYGALHRWSVQYPGEFWATVWDHCELPGDRGERLHETGERFQDTRFLPDAQFNVAEALLAHWAGPGGGTGVAISFTGEDGESVALSGPDLRGLVARIQAALLADGVHPGDRVAAVVSNRPEAYALMIAVASIGAVFTSVSPDFGVDGIVERFAQVEPVVLVAVARYFYGGREHDIRPTLAAVSAALPSVRQQVLVTAGTDPNDQPGGWVSWADWLAAHPSGEPTFERFGYDQPWYILYSSGTTGRPKCIVHRTGGVLLKHCAEHVFQHDLGVGDRLCFFTTAGWMMWNWQASALASGIGLVLYDGSPFHPSGERLFDLVDAQAVTALGVSPRFLEACHQAGLRPNETHDLGSLRTLLITGSPLAADTARYVYRAVVPSNDAVQLAPISGGTDLCGVIIGAEPTSPVYAGQMQCAALGMDADVVDDAGKSLPVGEQGELVVRRPFPSMPLRFFGDDDGSRYHAAYFERYPGMWQHGDFAERTPEGGWIISGRSDATLNPGGVRIGTAEIYRQLTAIDAVVEAAAIGYQSGADSRVALFVQLRPGRVLDDELADQIRQRIRSHLSPRHVPSALIQAPDLPRTRSGKLSELAVRDVVNGRPVANTGALANPECLEFFSTVKLD